MPSPKKPGTTRLLVQVPDGIHAAAAARRRREGVTWSTVISTLLQRWVAGDHISKPVKASRPSTPDADEAGRLHLHWMATDEAYRRACTEIVDPSKLKWHRSIGELLAAGATRDGRVVLPEVVAAADTELADGAGDG